MGCHYSTGRCRSRPIIVGRSRSPPVPRTPPRRGRYPTVRWVTGSCLSSRNERSRTARRSTAHHGESCLLQVLLDGLHRSGAGLVGILTEFPLRPPLPEQIPALVE